MKIVFVCHSAYPEFLGGREHHIHHLASKIAENSDVTILAGGKKKVTHITNINGYKLVTLPMLSIKVSRNPLQIYRLVFGCYRAIKKECPDIVHAFEYGSNIADISCIYSKIYNVPFLLTVYGYRLKNPVVKIFKRAYDLLLGRWIIKQAKKIICNSVTQSNELLQIIDNPEIREKIVFQFNCINTVEYRKIFPYADIIKHNGLAGKTVITTVCRLLPRKGIKYILYALSRLITIEGHKNFKLLIIGPDCGEKSNLQRIVRRFKLNQYVNFIGPVTLQQVKNYISVSDIFVLASLYEGMPLALMEAMAAKKAVIFTALPGAEQLITNNIEGILVKPYDIKQLSEALKRFMENKGLREYMGANAARKIRQFDICFEARNTLRLYETLTQPP